MNKATQQKFYQLVGRALTVARQRRNMSITQLEKLSGEQFNTIEGIESGRPHYAHHTVWMKNVLGLDVNNIIRDMEGNHGKETEEGSASQNGHGDSGLKRFI